MKSSAAVVQWSKTPVRSTGDVGSIPTGGQDVFSAHYSHNTHNSKIISLFNLVAKMVIRIGGLKEPWLNMGIPKNIYPRGSQLPPTVFPGRGMRTV